eukprot:CAMPEP_0204371100 /NCGR_PEP_ID=MMETSP0469-20131031/46239_1 /ASSEMBLY_ACC=CAM_ASM_000384 /TAXON_ID=2969 /ORGANISM="Oxyrrhis marina" /LENGTH=65 /DNA_ID=CAMNT_0051361145 /DNA_START=31 /DNA_END=225 /DNA_ORIENTATION=-
MSPHRRHPRREDDRIPRTPARGGLGVFGTLCPFGRSPEQETQGVEFCLNHSKSKGKSQGALQERQ